MKNLYLIVLTIGTIAVGCTKDSSLEDLDYNKWEQDVPSYVVMDSSYATPQNPVTSNISVFVSFNENAVEQEWGTISNVRTTFIKTMFGSPTGNRLNKTIPFTNGKGAFFTDMASNNSTYEFQFNLEFENGRQTTWSEIYIVQTPPF